MFRKIIKYFADKRLLAAFRKLQREVKIRTLKDSKSIGILWNPVDEGSTETYESLRKILQTRSIKQKGLAYIRSVREMETLSTISNSGFLSSRSVRWFGRPTNSSGLEFVQEPFDILIDLSVVKCTPLEYILVHSKASFKVGWQGIEPNYYDFNLDVTVKPECRYLMEQVVYYLDTIND